MSAFRNNTSCFTYFHRNVFNMVVYHLHGQNGRFSVSKIQDWLISSWNRVFHVYKSVSFSEKRPPSRETGVKNDFEEMEHEIPSGTFCLEE